MAKLMWVPATDPANLPHSAYANLPLVRGVMSPTRNLALEEVKHMKRVYQGYLYDTAAFTATNGAIPASRKLQFFTQGLGQGISPVYGVDQKTEVDTNMRVSGGQLSAKQAFLADGLGFNIFPQLSTVTTIGGVEVAQANFTSTTPFQFMLNDGQAILNGFLALYGSGSTQLILGVLEDWPYGAGPYGCVGGVGPTANMQIGGFINNGTPEVTARYLYEVPKDFASGEDFRINSTNPNTMPSLITAAGTVEDPVHFTWVAKAAYFGAWRDAI
jgi:hypothetical protein